MARDRYEDEPDDEFDDRPRRRRPAADPAQARGAAAGPGIGLMLVALIGLGIMGYGLATEPPGGVKADLADRRQQQLDDIAARDMPADAKRQQTEMINNVYDAFEKILPAVPLIRGVIVVGTLVVLLGGVQLVRGRSRGLGMTSAILAMIPCFSGCACVLGIPVGIWALVVLGRPEVKAALSARPPADTLADDFDRA